MVDIHVHHDVDGYRTYITQGRKTIVIDGYFDGEHRGVKTKNSSTPYLYGT